MSLQEYIGQLFARAMASSGGTQGAMGVALYDNQRGLEGGILTPIFALGLGLLCNPPVGCDSGAVSVLLVHHVSVLGVSSHALTVSRNLDCCDSRWINSLILYLGLLD